MQRELGVSRVSKMLPTPVSFLIFVIGLLDTALCRSVFGIQIHISGHVQGIPLNPTTSGTNECGDGVCPGASGLSSGATAGIVVGVVVFIVVAAIGVVIHLKNSRQNSDAALCDCIFGDNNRNTHHHHGAHAPTYGPKSTDPPPKYRK